MARAPPAQLLQQAGANLIYTLLHDGFDDRFVEDFAKSLAKVQIHYPEVSIECASKSYHVLRAVQSLIGAEAGPVRT